MRARSKFDTERNAGDERQGESCAAGPVLSASLAPPQRPLPTALTQARPDALGRACQLTIIGYRPVAKEVLAHHLSARGVLPDTPAI